MKIKHIPALIQSAAMAFLLATVTCQQTTFAQGSLTPPGAPAPTMKTLEQIEPRIPISSLPYIISQPGSYYLTTNLTGVAGQDGITISGARVTLDLMGFELRGVPGALSGIRMNPATSPHVLNGSIVSWGQDGINGTNGSGGAIERLRVSNNGRYGISFGSASQVRHCIVFGNGIAGILLSNDVEVDDCVSTGNGTHGIQAGTGSTIRRCMAVGNSAAGITGSGLDGLNIVECNTEFNGSGIATLGQTIVKDCFARSNAVVGIAVGPGSTVQGCNASDNGTNGITVDLGQHRAGLHHREQQRRRHQRAQRQFGAQLQRAAESVRQHRGGRRLRGGEQYLRQRRDSFWHGHSRHQQ